MTATNIRRLAGAALMAGALGLSGCAQVQTQGYVPPGNAVAEVVPGADTRDSVRERLGNPTTTSIDGQSVWLYVSSRVETRPITAPRVISREILAVSFGGNGRVSQVDRIGLQDGRVIDLNTNTTVTDGRRLSFWQQLLGSIGNFSAEQFLPGAMAP